MTALVDMLLFQMPIDLGDNLILRFAQPDDIEAWVDFSRQIWSSAPPQWGLDLFSGQHPTVKPSDFTLVEDKKTGKIISSLCLISQTWSYRGIPFPCGQIELVATDPAYRQRGLVRKQFEVIHALSASRGELLQVIKGINWFYSQFGYEKALNSGGGRLIHHTDLPTPKESETSAYRLRPAQAKDYPFIREMYDYASRRQLFDVVRTPAQWDYEFSGRAMGSKARHEWLIIERADGERLGYVQYRANTPNYITHIELKPGIGYLNLIRSLLHGVWIHVTQRQSSEKIEVLKLALGRDHPIYPLLPKNSVAKYSYDNWYIRIPDLVAFLRQIRPALEANLIGTVAEGYSGELTLSFYRNAIKLMFERGQITDISWIHKVYVWGDANFPDLTFWQLVCGRRRFKELAEIYPDECCETTEAAVLLDYLFPKFTGIVWTML